MLIYQLIMMTEKVEKARSIELLKGLDPFKKRLNRVFD